MTDTKSPVQENIVHKVTPFLMFEGNAEEAMNFYVSVFEQAEILDLKRYGADEGGVEGTVSRATMAINGQVFMFFDSYEKHQFTFTASISLFVNCDSEAEIDALFAKLSEGGALMMPLDNYGFSQKFAWLADKFGVSWQLNYQ